MMKNIRFILVTLAFVGSFVYVLKEWKTTDPADVFSAQLTRFDVTSSQVFLSFEAKGKISSRLKLTIKPLTSDALKKPLYLATSDLQVNEVICPAPATCSFQNSAGLTRININQSGAEQMSTPLEIGFVYPELRSRRFAFKKNIEWSQGELVAPYLPRKYYETEITLRIPKS
jgi:hypothetical protein